MDQYRRNQNRTPRVRLQRGADGRLRPVVSRSEIGDVWAEQKRIRLSEAIRQDQRKAEKKAKIPKEITLNIGLPKLRLPKIRPAITPKLRDKRIIVPVVAALVVLVLGGSGYGIYVHQQGDNGQVSKVEVLNASSQSQVPQYGTILPEGRDIEALGGWARVSPPDKDPVFAYADAIGGVHISVSQQPLPDSFAKDVAGSLEKLARDFSANEKLTVGEDTVVYIGTSIRGPQSVVFAKGDLLVLIKSEAKVSSPDWASYISSLK